MEGSGIQVFKIGLDLSAQGLCFLANILLDQGFNVLAAPKGREQVGFFFGKQAVFHLAIRRQADPVAGAAKIIAHGTDH